jgi:hypothetical protein
LKPDLLQRFGQRLLRERTKLYRTVARTDPPFRPCAVSRAAEIGQARVVGLVIAASAERSAEPASGPVRRELLDERELLAMVKPR